MGKIKKMICFMLVLFAAGAPFVSPCFTACASAGEDSYISITKYEDAEGVVPLEEEGAAGMRKYSERPSVNSSGQTEDAAASDGGMDPQASGSEDAGPGNVEDKSYIAAGTASVICVAAVIAYIAWRAKHE